MTITKNYIIYNNNRLRTRWDLDIINNNSLSARSAKSIVTHVQQTEYELSEMLRELKNQPNLTQLELFETKVNNIRENIKKVESRIEFWRDHFHHVENDNPLSIINEYVDELKKAVKIRPLTDIEKNIMIALEWKTKKEGSTTENLGEKLGKNTNGSTNGSTKPVVHAISSLASKVAEQARAKNEKKKEMYTALEATEAVRKELLQRRITMDKIEIKFSDWEELSDVSDES